MNSAAFATKSCSTAPTPSSRRSNTPDNPAHPEGRRADITVIAGGLNPQRRRPLHARAEQTQPATSPQPLTHASLHRSAKGVPFGLTEREYALASCFGVLFTAVSLAVAIL